MQTCETKSQIRNSFKAARGSDKKEEQEAWNDAIFPSFLAIGTLGLDPLLTPTFSISLENIITEKEDEVTENELRLINDELEKVLVLTNNSDDSSGRNSHGSSSGESNTVCPLQEYLFGSAFELSETTTTRVSVSKNKEEEEQRGERTSLAELFQRSKVEDQNNRVEEAKKKRMVHTSVDSSSADRKLHNKIIQMFQKKRAVEKKKKRMNENKEQWIKTDADYLVLEL
ncbi:unnamed protein product [Lathyrus sativus]|nr:unnamed protein product [Lathyrus sativus]